MAELLQEIGSYWSTRTEGYSEVNQKELEGIQKAAWLKVLKAHFPADKNKEELKILDIGTGPGFFPMILAEDGYRITAVDYTEGMLEKAKENAGALAERIEFCQMDAQNLDFESDSFDVVISRNVTWNLENPSRAYHEWQRVLREGGVLLNFDANWYGYLYDEEKREAYEQDRKNVENESLDDHYLCTDIDRMEEIAKKVPLSRIQRPQWDACVLIEQGMEDITTDTEIWKSVWSEEEKLNYASTPMFMVCAKKKQEKAFRIGGIEVAPGERFDGDIRMMDGSLLPVTILNGKNPGKTMLITAGMHAAEYVGIQTAIDMALNLKIEKVHGTLVIVKVVNRESFEVRGGSLGLQDGLNPYRVFPGRPDGSEMEKLAWNMVQTFFACADYYIDLHSGDDYEQLTPYVYYAGRATDEVVSISREMAQQVDVPYMVRSEVVAGGGYNYAAVQGIPSILLERGSMGQWTQEEVSSTKRDVKNILRHLGIYEGEKDYKTYYPLDVVEVSYQAASHMGCWYPTKKPGDVFFAGDILGEVRDYQGKVLEICQPETDGVILFQTGTLQVTEAGPMIAYGRIERRKDDRKDRITRYWGKRSASFMEQRRAELHSPLVQRWQDEIVPRLPKGRELKILDVGCGSGFFSILLAKLGHAVTGTDLTPEMVKCSIELAKEEGVSPRFLQMDAENLDFEDESFDVVISRNLTWTLPHAERAYEEWNRVLKPGGVLLNFDANYGSVDFSDTKGLPKEHAHNHLGNEMMREGEEIKRQLPISSYMRPAWDLGVLGQNGMEKFVIDLGVSRRIYITVDEFYNPTPLFMLTAEKAKTV